MNARRTAGSAAGQAAHSDALEHLARVGLIAYGVVHLLVAWLALQLAWGGGGGEPADQSGALATLAETPVGGPLLWVVGLGLVALAAWQAAEVARWRHGWSASGEDRKKALWKSGKALAKAVVYGALGVLALRFATGGGQSSGGQQQQTAAGVLGWPGGQWIVGAAGLVVIGIGVHHVHKGLSKGFLKEIDTSRSDARARRLVTRVGQVGYPGKGVALLLVGGLVVWAAVTYDPQKAGGLDAALRTLQQAPFGWALLTLVAIGIAAFGVFCFARARYPERR
ncbi:DUF1206 domain-containing protein [Geodermatophilus sp. YIM 151500]|uniref:DUF1206 domain-containing protein n=1 Tax=Geodermatophilus sp. YIM 151500 TaxID=2984531 RepID=UPI0021E4417E|nr:DUF1206 domain-containing protein [Geodermatophilus sp. YIM 151500]MCV2488334.1 DUF1206 domain-containing protein [Geodermatophilus sp. YIM 151500]